MIVEHCKERNYLAAYEVGGCLGGWCEGGLLCGLHGPGPAWAECWQGWAGQGWVAGLLWAWPACRPSSRPSFHTDPSPTPHPISQLASPLIPPVPVYASAPAACADLHGCVHRQRRLAHWCHTSRPARALRPREDSPGCQLSSGACFPTPPAASPALPPASLQLVSSRNWCPT